MSNKSDAALLKLKADIDEWVDEVISDEYPKCPRSNKDDEKVVREAVTGYQILKPYECRILDSPIVQRLRYIHQTALSYYLYPTATHSRFDHSLGMAKIAQQIGLALGLSPTEIDELRIASILHDVGHSLFSHASEKIIETRFQSDFDAIKDNYLFSDCSIHEIISYLIVRSDRFTQFLENVFAEYDKKISVAKVGRLIIGKPSNPKNSAYMGDIIHGPFDADKLDYLVRDCYFTGIRADIDVERIILACTKTDTDRIRGFPNPILIMKRSGVSNLEQIVLNKVLLYSAIYHHQKIRAIECMIKGIFEVIFNSTKKISNPALKFKKVSDFLKFSEYSFFSLQSVDDEIGKRIGKLLNRELLKRCLIISPNLAHSPVLGEHDLYKLGEENPEQISKLRKFIWDELPKRFRTSFSDLWVDFPKPPNIDNDADRCWVDIGTDKPRRLRDFLPYGEWLDAYEVNKWQGHVFYVEDPEFRRQACNAAKNVFHDLYQMKFDPPAIDDCKHS